MKYRICEYLKEHPGATLDELKLTFKGVSGFSICLKSLVTKGHVSVTEDKYNFVSMPEVTAADTMKPEKVLGIKEEKAISMEDFKAFMQQTKDEINAIRLEAAKELAAVKAISEVSKQPLNKNKAIPVAAIPKDDLLDEPAIFYCFRTQLIITGDRRNGFAVGTPYGTPIHFKFRSRTQRHIFQKADFAYIAYAEIKSKAEAEWLRGHSLYGMGSMGFDEKMGNIVPEDMDSNEFKFQAFEEIRNLDENQIITLARNTPGVTMSDDIRNLRMQIANIRSKKLVSEQRARATGIVEQNLNLYNEAQKGTGKSKLSATSFAGAKP